MALPIPGLNGIYQDILAYGILNPAHNATVIAIAGFFEAQC